MFASLKFSRETLGADLSSGLTVALVSIPEGMAYALVAGVNPNYGLYTGMLTTIVASLTASTSLVVVTLTNAMALVAGERLAGLGGDVDPNRALFTLTLLVGVIMFALGALKLGSVIRFVSREVMSGFIFSTALLIVVGFEVMIKEARELVDGWKVSRMNTIVAVITILVGVFQNLTAAIFTGVFLSLLLFTFTSAGQFKVVSGTQ
jgi:SulP family sulfate permease